MYRKKVKIVFYSSTTGKKLFSVKIERKLYDKCMNALAPDETFEEFLTKAIRHQATPKVPPMALPAPKPYDVLSEWETADGLTIRVMRGTSVDKTVLHFSQTTKEGGIHTWTSQLEGHDTERLADALLWGAYPMAERESGPTTD